MDGIISRLLSDKKYGFITGSDSRSYFFHKTAIKNKTWENIIIMFELSTATRQRVKVIFDPIINNNKTRAENVRIIE